MITTPEHGELLRIGEVAEMIDRSPQTIKNWYKWMEIQPSEKHHLLPEVVKVGEKGIRHFHKADIPKLKKFRDHISYGSMSDFNRELWGKRGKQDHNELI